eukprot:PhF_6_TR2580/c0_g1_i2/m.4364
MITIPTNIIGYVVVVFGLGCCVSNVDAITYPSFTAYGQGTVNSHYCVWYSDGYVYAPTYTTPAYINKYDATTLTLITSVQIQTYSKIISCASYGNKAYLAYTVSSPGGIVVFDIPTLTQGTNYPFSSTDNIPLYLHFNPAGKLYVGTLLRKIIQYDPTTMQRLTEYQGAESSISRI